MHDGVPRPIAERVASGFGTAPSGGGSGQSHALVHDVQLAFAHSAQTIFYVMAGVMAVTFLVAVRWLPRGRIDQTETAEVPAVSAA